MQLLTILALVSMLNLSESFYRPSPYLASNLREYNSRKPSGLKYQLTNWFNEIANFFADTATAKNIGLNLKNICIDQNGKVKKCNEIRSFKDYWQLRNI